MLQRGYPQFGRSDNSQLEFLHFFNVSMGCPAPEKRKNVMRVNLLSQIKSSKIGQKLLIVRKLSPWKRDREKHLLTGLMNWAERAGHAIFKNTKFVEIGQKKGSKGPKSVYHWLCIQTLLIFSLGKWEWRISNNSWTTQHLTNSSAYGSKISKT